MVLVVGATGLLGGKITRRLLEKGKRVRIFVRDYPSSEQLARRGLATFARSLISAGAQPLYGDLRDRSPIESAMEHVDTVISTATAALREETDTLERVDLDGYLTLLEAAKTAGVEHFIYISAFGADPDSEMPWLSAKGLTEYRLRNSGLNYTILAPDAYMELIPDLAIGKRVLYSQPVTMIGSGERKHRYISNRDVAEFVVGSVDNPEAYNQYLPLGGPDLLSFSELVNTYERVTYLPIKLESVDSVDDVTYLPGNLASFMAHLETFDSDMDTTALANHFGIRLTTLEDFIRSQ